MQAFIPFPNNNPLAIMSPFTFESAYFLTYAYILQSQTLWLHHYLAHIPLLPVQPTGRDTSPESVPMLIFQPYKTPPFAFQYITQASFSVTEKNQPSAVFLTAGSCVYLFSHNCNFNRDGFPVPWDITVPHHFLTVFPAFLKRNTLAVHQ